MTLADIVCHTLSINPAAIAGVVAAKDDLDKLVDWARARGVTKLEVAGLTLELGPVPLSAPSSEEQRRLDLDERRKAFRAELDVSWAHVGGWQGTDEELDKLMARGGNW